MAPSDPDPLRARARALGLYGVLAHWDEAGAWAGQLIAWEDEERARRSLERRLRNAHIGRFLPLCDFNWSWPKQCDRTAVESLMSLDFLKDATNIVIIGANGVGKTTIAKNLAHQALIHGHTVLFTTAGQMLGDLTGTDSATVLRRRLRHYAGFQFLVIDLCAAGSYVESPDPSSGRLIHETSDST